MTRVSVAVEVLRLHCGTWLQGQTCPSASAVRATKHNFNELSTILPHVLLLCGQNGAVLPSLSGITGFFALLEKAITVGKHASLLSCMLRLTTLQGPHIHAKPHFKPMNTSLQSWQPDLHSQ